MTAKALITLATSKGYFTGRNKPGVYRYGYSDGVKVHNFIFNGTWQQFVKLIVALDSVK